MRFSPFPITKKCAHGITKNCSYQKPESEERIKLTEKRIDIMEENDNDQNIWHNWEQE